MTQKFRQEDGSFGIEDNKQTYIIEDLRSKLEGESPLDWITGSLEASEFAQVPKEPPQNGFQNFDEIDSPTSILDDPPDYLATESSRLEADSSRPGYFDDHSTVTYHSDFARHLGVHEIFSNYTRGANEYMGRIKEGHHMNGDVYKPFSLVPHDSLTCRDFISNDLLTEEGVAKRLSDLERVLPNLRDIAASSVQENIKTRLLYRSARPFCSDVLQLAEVMIELLGVNTVIDLRDDDMEYNKPEHLSRMMVMNLFGLQPPEGMTRKSDKLQEDLKSKFSRREAGIYKSIMRAKNEQQERLKYLLRYFQTGAMHPVIQNRPKHREYYEAEIQRCDEALKMISHFKGSRRKRKLIVLNVLEHPDVKTRINQQLSDNPHVVPFLLAVKATDMFSKKNNAAYFFSRIFISGESLLRSYTEMLQNCGFRFVDALRNILAASGPLLFHCTLGKDRTGLLSMLILGVLGASESAIMFDYSLTSYADPHFQSFIKRFIVEDCGLSSEFCGSNCIVMHGALKFIVENFGSIDGYLDVYGFREDERVAMRTKYLIDPSLYRPTTINTNRDR